MSRPLLQLLFIELLFANNLVCLKRKKVIPLHNLLYYLEQSAHVYPDKIAFSDENENVTFSQLKDIGRCVGMAIANEAQGLRLPIAVLTCHRVADIVAFVGALYAGCFYVPVDGTSPKEYIASRLSTIAPAMTIDAKTISELPQVNPIETTLDRIRNSILPNDPAYAIFTSGSTGTPKAAVISHGSAVNLVEWLAETFDFSEQTVFAGQCPFYFDASVKEIYSTLKNAATMHLIPRKFFSFPLKVMRYIEEVGANVLPWAVSAVKMMANSGVFDRFVPTGIKDVIFGGENMPSKTLNTWKNAMPETRFTNVYGPAEITVDCAYYTVDRSFPDGESIPIGRPCRNVELLLLDEDAKPVPQGEAGEIYVRGVGVGLGYWNDPARTSTAFVQNPLNHSFRDIVYRTGDIAKYNQYGELVFLSRADYQVKHMGSRIELGEIETAATGIEGIHLVCCIYDKENSKILLYYEGSISEKEVAKMLDTRLPRYMQPNIITKIDKMPTTPNGKIDRNGL